MNSKDITRAFKTSSQAPGFGCKAMYTCQNREYGQKYRTDEITGEVPTYVEIVDTLKDFRKMEKLLKNKEVAAQFSKEINMNNMDDIEKEKYKFDRNVVVPKKFPVQGGQYHYPEPSQNIGNVLYKTTNRTYGSKPPSQLEIPNKFFPHSSEFTRQYPGNYKFYGLNTAKILSKVHKAFDE